MSQTGRTPPAESLRCVPLGSPLTGHTGDVRWGAWGTVDGRPVLATGGGGDDATVRLWDPATGRSLGAPLIGHTRGVWWGGWGTVKGRPMLATGGEGRIVRLWDPAGDQIGRTLVGHPSGVRWGSWGAVGDRAVLATGSRDETVRLWDPGSGKLLCPPLIGHAGGAWWGAWWSLDGQPVLATGGHDATVRLWDPVTGRQIGAPLTGHTGDVRWGAWTSVDGRAVLATGGDDPTVRLWDPATGSSAATVLTGHSGGTRRGVWGSVDGRPVLATGGRDAIVRLWDPAAGVPGSSLLAGHSGSVWWCAWAAVDERPVLATGADDGDVRLWDPAAGRPVGTPMAGHVGGVWWGAWNAVGERAVLATGGRDGTVRLCEVVRERPVPATLPPYRSDTPTTADELDRAADAAAVAQLITARSARPPLAVGLFGDWGEGKSHFMALLQHQVAAATRPDDPLTHGFVRQVRFNAWHYAETDLWASLVTELFAQLAAPPGAGPESAVAEQRRQSRLAAELIARRGLPERLAAARARRDELRRSLEQPAGLWSALPEGQRQQLRTLLGDRPEKVYAEAVATGRAFRRLLRARLFGAIAISALLVAAIVWWLPAIGRWVAAVPAIVAVLATGQALASFVAETRRRGSGGWQAAVRYGEQQRLRLTAAADAADAEVEALRREMRDFTAAGQLAGVVTDRDTGGDYRSRLSMMTRIRQDFARMSELLARAGVEDAPDAAGDELPRIDRIVVYIDDLDRCPPRRVVEMLEAVHLLLAVDLFVVVVAVDPRWLLSAITAHYRDVLDTAPAAGGKVADPDDEALWQSTPTQYLEKIFQVVLTLPPLDTTGYQRMLRNLVGTRADQPAPAPPASPARDVPPARAAPAGGVAGADGVAPAVRLPAGRVVERVDPFALDPDEIRLLDLLGPPSLIVTPRQVKRLANSYGLLTVLRGRRRPADLSEQAGAVADPGRRPVSYRPYRAAMVLLAALVSYPALGPGLFVHLQHAAARQPHASWADFIATLRPRPTDAGWRNRDGLPLTAVQAQQWQALADALHGVSQAAADHDLPLPEQLSAWAEWVVPVGRLSFPTGRVVSSLDRYQPLPQPWSPGTGGAAPPPATAPPESQGWPTT